MIQFILFYFKLYKNMIKKKLTIYIKSKNSEPEPNKYIIYEIKEDKIIIVDNTLKKKKKKYLNILKCFQCFKIFN